MRMMFLQHFVLITFYLQTLHYLREGKGGGDIDRVIEGRGQERQSDREYREIYRDKFSPNKYRRLNAVNVGRQITYSVERRTRYGYRNLHWWWRGISPKQPYAKGCQVLRDQDLGN